jgi:hypothetical protein
MASSADIHRRIVHLSEPYGGVLSRELLRDAGIGRGAVARQVQAARWRVVGLRTVATHTGDLGISALGWRAVWEVGRPDVAVDGVSALLLDGLTGYETGVVDVSVPWTARVARVPGVRIHRVCRGDEEVRRLGVPRVRAPTATVRAAHWAASDRQAALLLALPVQQRLVRAHDLGDVTRDEHVRGRRELVRRLVADITNGAQSLGELDFACLCRRAGLPEPDRQAVVRSPAGRIYLDVRWSAIGLVVEIDGSQHRQGLALGDDHLRQNAVTIGNDLVLRFDLLVIRLRADEVVDQVWQAYSVLRRRRSEVA